MKWEFDQPKNCAVITKKKIIEGKSQICFVSHDLDDDGWQFLDNENPTSDQIVVISLKEMVDIDQSIVVLSTMKPGFCASRKNKDSNWDIKNI